MQNAMLNEIFKHLAHFYNFYIFLIFIHLTTVVIFNCFYNLFLINIHIHIKFSFLILLKLFS